MSKYRKPFDPNHCGKDECHRPPTPPPAPDPVFSKAFMANWNKRRNLVIDKLNAAMHRHSQIAKDYSSPAKERSKSKEILGILEHNSDILNYANDKIQAIQVTGQPDEKTANEAVKILETLERTTIYLPYPQEM